MRRIGIACLVALLEPAPTSAQEADLVGCYDVTLGEWVPGRPAGSDSWYFTPPPRIELTDTFGVRHGARRSDRPLVTPAPGVMPSVHSIASWSTLPPDSVEILWSNGFTGVRLHLSRTEEGLEGIARSFTDVRGGPRHEAPAIAQPVECDAPVPEPWRERYPHGRGFLLVTGDSLRLDAPLPSGVTGDSVANAGLMLDIVPGGVLAGATGIDVGFDPDGHVRAIRVRFPSDTRLDDLVMRMAAVWGPPATVWSDTTRSGEERSGAEWEDPLIIKRLGRNSTRHGAIEVVVYMASRNVIRGRRRASR